MIKSNLTKAQTLQQASLAALEMLAERTGDKELSSKVTDARVRIRALQEAEAAAREVDLPVTVVASAHTTAGLVEALVALFSR